MAREFEEEKIKRRLEPLNDVTIPERAELKIRANLEREIQAYGAEPDKRGSQHRLWRRALSAASAAAFVLAAGSMTYFAILQHGSNHVNEKNIALHKTSAVQRNGLLAKTTYTPAKIQKVKSIAIQKHVTPYLPQQVLPGGHATIVKPGTTSLIVDYKRIWIIESNKSFNVLQNQSSLPKQTVHLANGKPATFLQYKNVNNVLYFKTGNTYVAIQHLNGAVPTKKELIAIANSFVAVK